MTPGDQAYLLTIAALLRNGLLADPPAAYDAEVRKATGKRIARAARRHKAKAP